MSWAVVHSDDTWRDLAELSSPERDAVDRALTDWVESGGREIDSEPSPASPCSNIRFPFDQVHGEHAPHEGTIATYKPVTYLIDALRALIATGWDATTLLKGIAALLTIGGVSITSARLALRKRVAQQS